jgi:hypothetical protein
MQTVCPFCLHGDHGRPVDFNESDISRNNPFSIAMEAAKACFGPEGDRGEAFLEDFMALGA